MTTNYVERLDAALIRPGRVDVVELIGDADATRHRGYSNGSTRTRPMKMLQRLVSMRRPVERRRWPSCRAF